MSSHIPLRGGIVVPLLLWIHKLKPFRVLQTKRKLTSAAYFGPVSFARLMTFFSHHRKHATSYSYSGSNVKGETNPRDH
jgi:hypothetical protein